MVEPRVKPAFGEQNQSALRGDSALLRDGRTQIAAAHEVRTAGDGQAG